MEQGYVFRIAESYSPASIPMERLAAYLHAFARLLGEPQAVHFKQLIDASVGIAAQVDVPAQPKVYDRIEGLRRGDSLPDVARAFEELDQLLRDDNAVGSLTNPDGAIIIPFPGRERRLPTPYGPFWKEAAIDGRIIRIGGKDASIHVQIEDGPLVHSGLSTTREIARKLKGYLLEPVTIRFRGKGQFFRSAQGFWELRQFKINDFDVLDEAPLVEVIGRLRAVSGSEWSGSEDPVQELLGSRHNGEEAH